MKKDFDPNFEYPPSVQGDLFNYLKPEQQEAVKPILRVLKKPAQEELCCSLLDFMETGEALPPSDLTLAAIFMYLTREGLGEDQGKAIICPLTHTKRTSRDPQPIGDILKSMIPFTNSN